MVFQAVLLSAVLFLMFYAKMRTGILLACVAALCVLWISARFRHGHTHGAFLSIDAYAQRSKLRTWHSGLKTVLTLICVFACIAADSLYIPVYMFMCMTFITVALGKTPVSYYISLIAVPLVFILLSCLAILVEISPAPAGVLALPVGGGYICVTEQSQYLALKTALRALGSVSCLYMLSLSTPIYHIIAVLRKVKLPSVIIDLMYLIYRYLFILLDTHRQMVHASEARLGYRNIHISMKTMMKNALGLMFISLRRTSDMFAAMEARCYDGDIRFIRREYRAARIQIVVSAALPAGALILFLI